MSGPPTPGTTDSISGAQNANNADAYKTAANASNYNTPYNSLQYSIDKNGHITANSTYSDAEKPLFQAMTGALQPGALGLAGGALGSFFNNTGGTGSPNIVGAGNNLAQQYATLATQAVEPNMAWMIQNNQNDLANKGLFESTNTNTPNNAADRSMQNMYAGLGQAISGFQSQLLPQATQAEEMQNYTNPMNTIAQMFGLGAPIGLQTNPGAPNFSPNPADMVKGQNNAYDQQSKQFGSEVGGISTLLGMFL